MTSLCFVDHLNTLVAGLPEKLLVDFKHTLPETSLLTTTCLFRLTYICVVPGSVRVVWDEPTGLRYMLAQQGEECHIVECHYSSSTSDERRLN